MIGYETYCQIRHLHGEKGLTFTQIAQELALDPETVAKYARRESFPRRASGRRRASKLDSFKQMIIRLLERHPYSTTQLYDLLRQEGYEGGMSILKDYVCRVRPVRHPAYLTLAFAPGEAAQVGNWGSGSIFLQDRSSVNAP